MSIKDESFDNSTNDVTGTECVLCGGYGYIEIFRSDWEEYEEIECCYCKSLKKKGKSSAISYSTTQSR